VILSGIKWPWLEGDLVDRLRALAYRETNIAGQRDLLEEAAAEIERLRNIRPSDTRTPDDRAASRELGDSGTNNPPPTSQRVDDR
jgi:hypothetical protein